MKKLFAVCGAAFMAAALAAPAVQVFAAAADAPAVQAEKLDLGNFWGFWTNWEGMEDLTLSATATETYAF